MSYKSDFPIFQKHPDLVYLDSTATALKPQVVIDKITEYYSSYSANVMRGLYPIAEQATSEMEAVRSKVKNFINANDEREVIFTHNTSESLNLLAYTLGQDLKEGDEVVVTSMEHHSNFVPWQQLGKKYGWKFIVIPFDQDGKIQPETLTNYITPQTKIFSFIHVSNVLGTVNDAQALVAAAKKINPDIITIIDAAQSAPNIKLNVKKIDCDFLAFSSHKLFGPTGVGVLWGKKERLENLPPFLYGGEMVESVKTDETIFQDLPHKFEAGTPAIGEIIGFGAAIDYVESIGVETIEKYEDDITQYAYDKLIESFGKDISIFGPKQGDHRAPLVSFLLSNIHPHDTGHILAEEGVCVRAGSHCAMPLHNALNLSCPSSTRASFSIYTDKQDIDKLVSGLKKVRKVFGE